MSKSCLPVDGQR